MYPSILTYLLFNLTLYSGACIARIYLLGTGIILVLAPLVYKQYKLYSNLKAVAELRSVAISNSQMILITSVFAITEIVLISIWVGDDPPVPTESINFIKGNVETYCTSHSSEVYLWVILGYKV